MTYLEIVLNLKDKGIETVKDQDLTLWRTGREYGPESPDTLKALGEIIGSTWIQDHNSDISTEIMKANKNKYARVTDHFIKKAASKHTRWTRSEKEILEKANLTRDDLRGCRL